MQQENTLEKGSDSMELNKCSRCGAFYASEGDICPKCASKDNLELSTFKSYIEQNGYSTVDTIATETWITQKNVSRFLEYEGINNISEIQNENFNMSGIVLN